ncbi:MAG: GDSL-type esterase/lipase family protein [Candidatus Adiutrix sp.]|jgi:lysophospholipase L1-like esterase|nr:GDSL-type esterase/lipase family protein [Candidatus Adiutrix sp.]
MTFKLPVTLSFFLIFSALLSLAAERGQASGGLRALMLGDSLTAGGDWPALLPGVEIINQGLSGQTSGQILTRLDSVAEARPDLIFLLAGVNDFYVARGEERIVANHLAIWRELARKLPQARLQVISLTPVSERKYPGLNRRIRAVNRQLEGEARKMGLSFIDLYSPLADEEGALRPEYTYDGLHFSAEGYRVWAVTINPYLKEARP